MNILIAGASGFIGKELTAVLSQSHHVTVLGRDLKHLQRTFPEAIEKLTWDSLHQHDAQPYEIIINLSGANIGAKRWTQKVKNELISSRTLTNKNLIDWLIKYHAKPHFYCANAIGIYGARSQDTVPLDEDTTLNDSDVANDFAKKICLDWQQSLQPAIDYGIKVTTLRFGVVLKKGEGMLKKLELPFSLGLGSVFGSGQQEISWVHYEDVVRAIVFLLEHQDIIGAVNVTASHPVTQKQFAKDFAAALKRPLLFSMPAFVVKTLFGEMGDELILKGQRVIPKRLIEHGFTFKYPELHAALNQEYHH